MGMGENDGAKTFEMAPLKRKGEGGRIHLTSTPSSTSTSTSSCSIQEHDDSPLRPIFYLKKIVDLKRFDKLEDCYVLDFDPFDSLDLSLSKDDNSELSIVGEKGQVACRDYPHARYLCLKFPFETTPHESYCEMCYCYVCDTTAPCDHWTPHCHASHSNEFWKRERRSNSNNNTPTHLQ